VNIRHELLKTGRSALLSGSLALLAMRCTAPPMALAACWVLIANGFCPIPGQDRDHSLRNTINMRRSDALAIAAFILFAPCESSNAPQRLINGIGPLRHHPRLKLRPGSAGAFCGNSALAFYERREGQRLQSRLLLADAMHTTSDILDPPRCVVGYSGALGVGLNWLESAVRSMALLLVAGLLQVIAQQSCPGWWISIAIAPRSDPTRWLMAVQECSTAMTRRRGCDLGQQGVFIDMHMCGWRPTILTPPPIGSRNLSKSTWRLASAGRCHHSLEPREYASARSPSVAPMVELDAELACLS